MTGMPIAPDSSRRAVPARRAPASQPSVLNDHDMASTISQGTTTVGWTYSPDRLRLKMCAGGCTSPTSTTLYLRGPAYSEKVTAGATTTWHDSITADGELVATRTKSGSTVTMQYLVNDHLGSPAVVTDSSGAVIERDSFDAWGQTPQRRLLRRSHLLVDQHHHARLHRAGTRRRTLPRKLQRPHVRPAARPLRECRHHRLRSV